MINGSNVLISIFFNSLYTFATTYESRTDGSTEAPFSTDDM